MYDLHLESYVRQLLPPQRKKPQAIALFRTILSQIAAMFNVFSDYRRESTLEITATGQVAVLEFNLCRLMGLPANYIYISGSYTQDFAVLIPASLTAKEEEECRRYVEKHKLIGKSFEIIRNI